MRVIKNTNKKVHEVSYLNKLIDKAPEGSIVMTFTPEIAEHILSNLNVGNRPQKHQKIIEYAKDMAQHNWSLTGETIKFGTDGLLKDGQNRLAACIRSQTPFKTHAVFGIDPQSFHHMDTGKMRGADDVLAIMGVPNASKISGALKLIDAFKRGASVTGGNTSANNQKIKDMYLNEIDHDLIQDSVRAAKSLYNIIKYPMGQTIALHYLASIKGNRELVDKFFDELKGNYSKGQNVKYHPPRYLVTTLQSWRMDPLVKITSAMYSIAISRSWYSYKNGANMLKRDMVIRTNDRMMEI